MLFGIVVHIFVCIFHCVEHILLTAPNLRPFTNKAEYSKMDKLGHAQKPQI